MPRNTITIGIKVIGWSLLSLAGLQLSQWWDCAGFWEVHQHLYRAPMDKVFFALTPLLLAAEVFLALNVLKMKEWARKGVLVILGIYVVMALAMSFSFKPGSREYIVRRYEKLEDLQRELALRFQFKKAIYVQKLAAATSISEQEIITRRYEAEVRADRAAQFFSALWMWLTTLAAVLKYVVWNVAAAVFLTRPEVKRKFM